MSCGLPVPGPAEAFTQRLIRTDEVASWYHVYCTRTWPRLKAAGDGAVVGEPDTAR